jgi:hypothetical protein
MCIVIAEGGDRKSVLRFLHQAFLFTFVLVLARRKAASASREQLERRERNMLFVLLVGALEPASLKKERSTSKLQLKQTTVPILARSYWPVEKVNLSLPTRQTTPSLSLCLKTLCSYPVLSVMTASRSREQEDRRCGY